MILKIYATIFFVCVTIFIFFIFTVVNSVYKDDDNKKESSVYREFFFTANGKNFYDIKNNWSVTYWFEFAIRIMWYLPCWASILIEYMMKKGLCWKNTQKNSISPRK